MEEHGDHLFKWTGGAAFLLFFSVLPCMRLRKYKEWVSPSSFFSPSLHFTFFLSLPPCPPAEPRLVSSSGKNFSFVPSKRKKKQRCSSRTHQRYRPLTLTPSTGNNRTQSFALETTDPTKSDFRVQGAENFKPFLSCLERYGVHELDTARVYCEGDTETVLGQVLGSPTSPFKPFEVSTKVYPIQPGDHGPEALTRHLYRSLEQLKRDKVKIFYLHAPDFYTPFEVTLKAVDELHKEGLFEEVSKD